MLFRSIISDSFPYIGDTLYLPKPLTKIASQKKDETNYKIFKKLNYVPIQYYEDYITGNVDSEMVKDWTNSFDLGESFLLDKVSLQDVELGEDSKPYAVGTYRYNKNAGLYFLAQGKESVLNHLMAVLDSLQYSGIGGKRFAGFGLFQYEVIENTSMEKLLIQKKDKQLLLSTAMASPEELSICLPKARYLLRKRSGFVQSDTYEETLVKKKDFYSFTPGSVFVTPFSGSIFDVGENGRHPVYRYAKAMWMGVS